MSSAGKGPIDRQLVITPALTDETLGVPVDVLGYDHVTFYVTGTGTVSSGILTYEEAPSVDWAGTWSSITTTDFASVQVSSGALAAIHLTAACHGAVRCRISTVIGGTGTITVYLSAQ